MRLLTHCLRLGLIVLFVSQSTAHEERFPAGSIHIRDWNFRREPLPIASKPQDSSYNKTSQNWNSKTSLDLQNTTAYSGYKKRKQFNLSSRYKQDRNNGIDHGTKDKLKCLGGSIGCSMEREINDVGKKHFVMFPCRYTSKGSTNSKKRCLNKSGTSSTQTLKRITLRRRKKDLKKVGASLITTPPSHTKQTFQIGINSRNIIQSDSFIIQNLVKKSNGVNIIQILESKRAGKATVYNSAPETLRSSKNGKGVESRGEGWRELPLEERHPPDTRGRGKRRRSMRGTGRQEEEKNFNFSARATLSSDEGNAPKQRPATSTVTPPEENSMKDVQTNRDPYWSTVYLGQLPTSTETAKREPQSVHLTAHQQKPTLPASAGNQQTETDLAKGTRTDGQKLSSDGAIWPNTVHIHKSSTPSKLTKRKSWLSESNLGIYSVDMHIFGTGVGTKRMGRYTDKYPMGDSASPGLPVELMPIHPGGGSRFDDWEREKLERNKMAQKKDTSEDGDENGGEGKGEGSGALGWGWNTSPRSGENVSYLQLGLVLGSVTLSLPSRVKQPVIMACRSLSGVVAVAVVVVAYNVLRVPLLYILVYSLILAYL